MVRIGFDIGGTKLAAIALDGQGRELGRRRERVPRDYAGTRDMVVAMVRAFGRAHGPVASVGLSLPGMIGAGGELLRMVNLPWLEGTPLRAELSATLDRPVVIANDANCFALSEATDGAAAGARLVFGATLGTGVGGAIVVDGRPLVGANAIAGEWGHNPLGVDPEDGPPLTCGCGRTGCVETWLNGSALARDHGNLGGEALAAPDVARLAEAGDTVAGRALGRYQRRLAMALGQIVNILDPEVIVLGGSVATMASLYTMVPRLWGAFTVAAAPRTRLVPARFGPDSGLRGAAWLAGPS
jgi:fructokinase